MPSGKMHMPSSFSLWSIAYITLSYMQLIQLRLSATIVKIYNLSTKRMMGIIIVLNNFNTNIVCQLYRGNTNIA